MKSLTGKVAIVTGAGRGIGKAISLFLSGSGARVVLASRSESELRAVAGEIRNQGGELKLINVNARIRELFKVTNLQHVFDIYEDESDAIAKKNPSA